MERIGDWMQTYTGVQFWPMDPMPCEIFIEDIAHSLSNLCRYNGHCRHFYSVAEHCVHISGSVEKKYALAALLHDAAESYVSDVPRPLKPFLINYSDIEKRVMEAILKRFKIDKNKVDWNEIKRLDNMILVDESSQLMGTPPATWNIPNVGIGITIGFWPPAVAFEKFMEKFKNLTAIT